MIFFKLHSIFILQWLHAWNLILQFIIHSVDTEFNSPWVPVWIRISSRIGPISCLKHLLNNLIYPTKWLISSGSKKMFVCCWSYAWLSYRVCCYATVGHSSMHKLDCSLTTETDTLHSSMLAKVYLFTKFFQTLIHIYSLLLISESIFLSLSSFRLAVFAPNYAHKTHCVLFLMFHNKTLFWSCIILIHIRDVRFPILDKWLFGYQIHGRTDRRTLSLSL